MPASSEMARRGRIGARARWGDPRHVKLTSLHPAVRAAVIALIEADEAAKKAASAVSETSANAASAGGHGSDHAAI